MITSPINSISVPSTIINQSPILIDKTKYNALEQRLVKATNSPGSYEVKMQTEEDEDEESLTDNNEAELRVSNDVQKFPSIHVEPDGMMTDSPHIQPDLSTSDKEKDNKTKTVKRKRLPSEQKHKRPTKKQLSESSGVSTEKVEADISRVYTEEQYSTIKKDYDIVHDQLIKSRIFLEELLKEQAKRERQDVRNKAMADCVRLGQITYERHGTDFVEVWQEGYAFQQLSARQKAIEKEKQEVESRKKSLASRKKDKKSGMDGIEEDKEACKFRLLALKKEETDIQIEEEK